MKILKSADAGFFARQAKQTRENDSHSAALPFLSPSRGCREGSRFLALLLGLFCTGCVNLSMTCPDKVSTVTYKGLSLLGATDVSCVPLPTGGYAIDVSGTNLMALAALVAPLAMAQHPKAQDNPDIVPDPNKNL